MQGLGKPLGSGVCIKILEYPLDPKDRHRSWKFPVSSNEYISLRARFFVRRLSGAEHGPVSQRSLVAGGAARRSEQLYRAASQAGTLVHRVVSGVCGSRLGIVAG